MTAELASRHAADASPAAPLPGHPLSRGARLGWAAARAGAPALLGQPVDPGPLMQALHQLKGPALKAAQLLSLEGALPPGWLPPGWREQLATACHQSPPLNRALVHKQFLQAFGQAPGQVFRRFEPVAFAAASLGQVHHATTWEGQAVAVKLQYPGVASALRSDLQMLGALLPWLVRQSGASADNARQLLAGARGKLEEELDYEAEALTLAHFARGMGPCTGQRVPAPLPTLCRPGILTMQALPGLHLDDWLAQSPGAAARDAAGQRLWDGFWHMVLRMGRFHADLHPGNLLFHMAIPGDEGAPDVELGWLDFGCTQAISADLLAGMGLVWSGATMALGASDATGQADVPPLPPQAGTQLLHGWGALGVFGGGLDAVQVQEQIWPAAYPLLAWQTAPWRLVDAEGRCDFGRLPALSWPDHRQAAPLSRAIAQLPVTLACFDRAWLGLLHLLRRLEARVDTRTTHPTRWGALHASGA